MQGTAHGKARAYLLIALVKVAACAREALHVLQHGLLRLAAQLVQLCAVVWRGSMLATFGREHEMEGKGRRGRTAPPHLAGEVARVELALQDALDARVAAEVKGQVAVRVDGGGVGAGLEQLVADPPAAWRGGG